MTDTIKFKHETAQVQLIVWENGDATVSALYSKERKQGHATALMQQVVEYADERNMRLILDAQQFGHPIGPDNSYLVAFYERFGFMVVNPRGRIKTMIRASQKKHVV